MRDFLAAQTLIAQLDDVAEMRAAAAGVLARLPDVSAAAARLDGETATEGVWEHDVGDGLCPGVSGDAAYLWQQRGNKQLLLLSVATLGRHHGCLALIAGHVDVIAPYLPFLTSFAAGIALALDQQQQRAELAQASEQQRQSAARFEQLFATMNSGFAVHEIITDDDGRPIDYRFLAVNAAFEALTGLKRDEIIGQTALAVLPGLESSWIETYGRVALGDSPVEFESFSATLGRHYHVLAYSPAPGRFAAVYIDVSEHKQLERDHQELIEQLQTQTAELRLAADDLTRASALADALNGINRLLHATRDFDEIMQRALNEGVRALALDGGVIEMHEDSFWRVRYQCGFSADDVGQRLSTAQASIAKRVAERREPLVIADLAAVPVLNVGFVHNHGLHAVVAVPLVVAQDVVGCLFFAGKRVRRFAEAEVDFCRKLGATAALALENARLLAREKEITRLSQALNEINGLVTSTFDTREIMQALVERAAAAVKADSCMVALRHGDEWVAEYGYPEVPGVIHESVLTDEAPFILTAVNERRPIAIDDCANDPRCRPEVQDRFGVRSVICLPLIVRDEALGVIFFNHHERTVTFPPEIVDFAAKLAAVISAALANAQLVDDLASSERLNVALSAIAAVVTRLLDHDEIMRRVVAQMAAAMGAESASICDLEGASWIPRYLWRIPEEWRDVPIQRERVTYANMGVEARRVVSVDDCESDERVDLELQHAWNVRSVAMAPLVVRAEVQAAIFVNYHSTAHAFTSLEVDFMERAAAIISGALENARLYETQREIATTLQQHFLHPLPNVADWEFAVASEPARAAELVGGDFHDVFPVSAHELTILLGDVEGKGVVAAGLTETVHAAARALAISARPASGCVLERLNRLLLLQQSQLVTALFAVLDPGSGVLSIASAGHPPPVYVHGDGRIEFVGLTTGLPLGAFDESHYVVSRAQLEPGDALVLYTDGVIDARHEGVFFAEQGLLATVARLAQGSAEEMAAGVREAVLAFADGLRDDMQILVVRRVPAQRT